MAKAARKKSNAGKITLILIVVFAIGLAGYGYFSQSAELRDDEEAAHAEALVPLPASDPLFIAKPEDIVIGKTTAPVTILEYSSLSCPHCAHFHNDVLPGVKKDLLDSGRAKLVFRHFPLNEPALRAAQLVECSNNREPLLATLFTAQPHWAFSDGFRADLKKIAAQNGIDAAAFNSCLADKESETALLAVRQEASTRAHVDSTPSFFVDGVKLEGTPSLESLTAAVENAGKPAGTKAK